MPEKKLAAIKPHALGKFLAWRRQQAESVRMQKDRLQAQLIALAPEEAKVLAHYLTSNGYLLDSGFQSFTFDGVVQCFQRDLGYNQKQFITAVRQLGDAWAGVVKVTLHSAKMKVTVQAVFPPPKLPSTLNQENGHGRLIGSKSRRH